MSDWDIFWYTIAFIHILSDWLQFHMILHWYIYCQSGYNFIWYYIYTDIVKVVTISYDITFIHIFSDLNTFSYHFIFIQISSDLWCILIPYYIFTYIVWLVTFWYTITFLHISWYWDTVWYHITLIQGPPWWWSYSSWIYNYLCNQYLSQLMLWVRIPLMARCTRFNLMRSSFSVGCDSSVVFSGFSGLLHQ